MATFNRSRQKKLKKGYLFPSIQMSMGFSFSYISVALIAELLRYFDIITISKILMEEYTVEYYEWSILCVWRIFCADESLDTYSAIMYKLLHTYNIDSK